MHQYLRTGWRNWSQYFGKGQIWSLTTRWNHFGFLISIPGVRNVLQSQEGVPDFFKFILSLFSTFLGVSGDLGTFFSSKIRNLFLTFEEVPDSWDGDQEPKMVPMCSQWPYLSFAKTLGSITSSSWWSRILIKIWLRQELKCDFTLQNPVMIKFT